MNSETNEPAVREPNAGASSTSRHGLNWPLFLAGLFGPPIFTFLCALTKLGEAAIPVALFGSGVGGIVSGVALGLRAGKSTWARVGFAILFCVVFAVVCFAMSFMGCMAGGFKVKMH